MCFEPFNILAVPIPENFIRIMTVHVVFVDNDLSYANMMRVRVDSRSDLYTVLDAILNHNSSLRRQSRYVAIEIIGSRVHIIFSLERRKLERIRDGHNIFL